MRRAQLHASIPPPPWLRRCSGSPLVANCTHTGPCIGCASWPCASQHRRAAAGSSPRLLPGPACHPKQTRAERRLAAVRPRAGS